MNLNLQPVDGPYFTTTYFWVTTGVAVILAAIAALWGER